MVDDTSDDQSIYGAVAAQLVVVERQGRGSLHMHGPVVGHGRGSQQHQRERAELSYFIPILCLRVSTPHRVH